ncbi:hypothetical protein PhCBS80983_g03382 [Powellomyces hirtus]|uniref:Uncharacterized protein n=1 Tax=Powellomyces hirtus TaxID=109895 RepID=A0A507E2J9_9FUNG|nr:hypothetical protein PhCBS80983_g03382 [Powellomyces hirtus]
MPSMTSTAFFLLLLAPLAAMSAPVIPRTAAPAPAPLLVTSTAKGVQNYVCDYSKGKWLLTGANADLIDDATGANVGTHYFENAVPHWKLSADNSFVAVRAIFPIPSPDKDAPSADGTPASAKNIPWLVTRKVACSQSGLLSTANYVARSDTVGGVAPPASTCTPGKHGSTVSIDYFAKYYFGK